MNRKRRLECSLNFKKRKAVLDQLLQLVFFACLQITTNDHSFSLHSAAQCTVKSVEISCSWSSQSEYLDCARKKHSSQNLKQQIPTNSSLLF